MVKTLISPNAQIAMALAAAGAAATGGFFSTPEQAEEADRKRLVDARKQRDLMAYYNKLNGGLSRAQRRRKDKVQQATATEARLKSNGVARSVQGSVDNQVFVDVLDESFVREEV